MKQVNSGRLRDGRRAEVSRIDTPDLQAGQRLVGFLGHKHEPWMWHIREWAQGNTNGLQALFYLATVDGVTAGCVANLRQGEIGNITHVYTIPEMRRLGVATLLLRQALADFEREAGRVLVLVAPFQDVAWRLYESCGFHGTCPEQAYGGMVKFLDGAEWDSLTTGSAREVCPVGWDHFPGALVLFGRPGPVQLRSVHMDSVGPRLVERSFIDLMRRMQLGSQDCALVVPGEGASVLGFGIVGEHPLWENVGARKLLDIHVHPAHLDAGYALLEQLLSHCPEPVECYCDSGSEDKIALLHRFGFNHEGGSQSALRFGTDTRDLLILARGSPGS